MSDPKIITYQKEEAQALLALIPTLTPIPSQNTLKRPSRGLLEGFKYTPAAQTDVQATWRRFGWIPHEQTTRTPSMVSDVSAIEVAKTIFRVPARAGEMALS